MAVIVVPGDPADGSLRASAFLHEGGNNANGDFETDARNGTGAEIDPGNDPLSGARMTMGGQKWNSGSQTNRYEAFIAFRPAGGIALPQDQGAVELVNATVRASRNGLQHDGAGNFAADDALQFFARDWNSPLSSSAWVDLMPLLTNPPLFEYGGWTLDRTPANNLYEASSKEHFAEVQAAIAGGTDLSYMVTLWSAIRAYPRDGNWLSFLNAANNSQVVPKRWPSLVMRTIRQHALNHVLGSSIQLTDGTAVFLRWDAANERVSLYYQKIGQTTPTLINHLHTKTPTQDNSEGQAVYFGIEPGAQTFGITRDDADNIYVAGPRGNPQVAQYGQKLFNVQSFKYTGSNSNHTWTRVSQAQTGENSQVDVYTHRGMPNNFAPVWVPSTLRSPVGDVAVLHSRRDGHWARFQLGLDLTNAGYWLGLAGSQKLHDIVYMQGPDASTYWRPWNSSGTGMDAFRDGTTIRYATFIQATAQDDIERSALGRLNLAGDFMLGWAPSSVSVASPHNPDAKIRAVWLGEGRTQYGIARHGHIGIYNKSDDTISRQIDLPSSNVVGFPSRAELQGSAAWDVIWDTGETDWLWIYYRDANNARKLRKVRWNYVTGAIDPSFEFTAEPLGPSGSEIVAIRLPRQQTDTRCVLLDVAMQDGGGDPLALITIRDTSMDVPPTPPVIQPIESFNAGGTKAIEWTFEDDNAFDYATYQDVEIRNVDTGNTVHSVSHITAAIVTPRFRYRYTIGAGVLTNDTSYQIRIRAYDAVDVAGDFSAWTPFSTTATGGLVVITEPAEDLLPLNRSSVLVKWSYTNSTPGVIQAGYRVRVYNDTTNVVISDTGVLTGTVTEYEVTGLASDVTYRIEVIIQDSNAATSGAGVRLVYPDYNNPSLPSIVAEPGRGYIEVRVTNPPPDGENPVTSLNQIARREIDQTEEDYIVIGTCPPNGVFQDWSVAAGVEYVYKARGQN
jgi:hypothetical protein